MDFQNFYWNGVYVHCTHPELSHGIGLVLWHFRPLKTNRGQALRHELKVGGWGGHRYSEVDSFHATPIGLMLKKLGGRVPPSPL